MIIDHTHPLYTTRWKASGVNRWNGAYYYSKEIVSFFIPRVRTNRSWVTINTPTLTGVKLDGAIVFIHNNLHPEHYDWLKHFNNLILVCGVPETCNKVSHLGTPIYLPLSIDTMYVSQFATTKTRKTAFVGRPGKKKYGNLPSGVDFIEGLERGQLLTEMAKYERVYAVGRTAIEAKVLGCEVLPYDSRYPDPDVWKVLDSRNAARMFDDMLHTLERKMEDSI